jgi:hypothetical protein
MVWNHSYSPQQRFQVQQSKRERRPTGLSRSHRARAFRPRPVPLEVQVEFDTWLGEIGSDYRGFTESDDQGLFQPGCTERSPMIGGGTGFQIRDLSETIWTGCNDHHPVVMGYPVPAQDRHISTWRSLRDSLCAGTAHFIPYRAITSSSTVVQRACSLPGRVQVAR